jgi:hypothetical protein
MQISAEPIWNRNQRCMFSHLCCLICLRSNIQPPDSARCFDFRNLPEIVGSDMNCWKDGCISALSLLSSRIVKSLRFDLEDLWAVAQSGPCLYVERKRPRNIINTILLLLPIISDGIGRITQCHFTKFILAGPYGYISFYFLTCHAATRVRFTF